MTISLMLDRIDVTNQLNSNQCVKRQNRKYIDNLQNSFFDDQVKTSQLISSNALIS